MAAGLAGLIRPRTLAGQSAVEFLIVLPVLVMLVFGTIQLGLIYQGRATLNYATMLAARAGALHNGNMGDMRNALARGLVPLFTRQASAAGYAEGLAKATAETAGAGLMTSIEVLSPTAAAFSDFGRPRQDGASGNELPNDTLSYRTTSDGSASKISIQDANLLHVRVTYCYRLIVPVIDRMLHFMLNTPNPDASAPSMSNPFGIGAPATAAPCSNPLFSGPRIQIRSEAMVRMQSAFYQVNLPAPAAGPGTPPGGTPPGSGWIPPGTTVPGEQPPDQPDEPDDPDDPGGPTDPGGSCTGPDCPVCPDPAPVG